MFFKKKWGNLQEKALNIGLELEKLDIILKAGKIETIPTFVVYRFLNTKRYMYVQY